MVETTQLAEVPARTAGHPVGNTDNRLYFADDARFYAGRYLHDGMFPVHTHSFMEIVVPTAGHGVHHSLAGRQRIGVGDVVLLRPGLWHGYEDCAALEVFNCCVSTDLLQHEIAWTRDDPVLGRLLWTGPYLEQRRGMLAVSVDDAGLARCLEHLEALDRLGRQADWRHRADVIGHLTLVLGELGRAFVGTDADARPDGPAHPSVVRAIQLLETRLAEPWTLVELAEELHLAPSYLVRLFRSYTGQPPMTYLTRHRIETAATLLLDTDEPVGQIARDIGWPDQNYFARRFRTHFGLSATAYRARFRDHAVRLGADGDRAERRAARSRSRMC